MRRHVMGLVFFFAAILVTLSASLAALGQPKPAPAKPDAGPTTATTAAAAGAKDAGASTGVAGNPSPTSTGTATSAPAGSGPAVPIPDKPAMDGATYSVRLRDLEARVDELKDQIRRSHTRLALLSDTILSGGAAGSRVEIIFHDEMSSAFRLISALFVVDGAIQYNRQDDTGALADQKEIPIFSGSIPPGDHTVIVKLKFQGNGYGVFTYLRGYKFDVQSAHNFTAVEGKTLQLIATSLEKGGVTTPLEQRPTIEWQEKVNALGAGGNQPAPAPGSTPAVKTEGQSGNGSVGGSVQLGGGK
jgi:hypothetical protein